MDLRMCVCGVGGGSTYREAGGSRGQSIVADGVCKARVSHSSSLPRNLSHAMHGYICLIFYCAVHCMSTSHVHVYRHICTWLCWRAICCNEAYM